MSNKQVHFTVVTETIRLNSNEKTDVVEIGVLCRQPSYYPTEPLISSTDLAGLNAAACRLNDYVNAQIADARKLGAREAISNLTAEIVDRVEKGGSA